MAASGAGGALLWREQYAPYGAKLADPAANRDDAGYTGHIQDVATGLTYMQARYYDPALGRFLSPDGTLHRECAAEWVGLQSQRSFLRSLSSMKPAAMNEAMRSLIASKSSDLHNPPDSRSMRPVRPRVSIRAPVTK